MKFRSPRQSALLIGIIGLTACTRQIATNQFRSQFLPVSPKPVATLDIARSLEAVEPPPLIAAVAVKDAPTFIAVQPKPAARITLDNRITQAERRFQEGRRRYQAGDVLGARAEFDAAIDTLLSVPDSTPDRHLMQAKLEELTDRIHRIDIEGLGAGDNQQNAIYERSPLQEILEMTFPINPEIKTKVKEQVRATTSQLPLDENDAVLRYINYFSSAGKGTLVEGLRRSGKYRPMISRILEEEGVPQELIFLAQAESGFQARAVSYKAAAGMWQFVAPRGQQYGLRQTAFTDDRLDPEKATRAGARHLKDLYKQFGDWYLAMAAYNCGPGCVTRAVERTGYADFWELRSRNVLPNETANYVPLIVAMTIVAKNLKDYGIEEVEMENPLEFDRVTMTANTSLQLAADLADVSPLKLREFNPSLIGAIIPSNFEVKVPAGGKDALTAGLLKIPPEKRATWRTHRVAEGETAASIARRYGTVPANLAPVSRESVEDLRAGDVVIIQAAAAPPPAPAPVWKSGKKLSVAPRKPGAGWQQARTAVSSKTLQARAPQGKALQAKASPYRQNGRAMASAQRKPAPVMARRSYVAFNANRSRNASAR